MSKISMPDILELSVPERIQLIGEIWDSIEAVPDALSLTQAQREELDRRLEDCRMHPDDEEPWEDIRAETLREL